jgi:hypothetical protein
LQRDGGEEKKRNRREEREWLRAGVKRQGVKEEWVQRMGAGRVMGGERGSRSVKQSKT